MLPLVLDGVAEREALARSDSLLEQLGLTARANHFPAQLSGGEMQRVGVVRAVAAKPALLLADEPTGNLDSENGRRVMELLAGLNRELKLTVVLATHSAEAAAYAHRTLGLRDGRIEHADDHEGLSPPV
jgi:predicted ABC-type transport system involved in lysophospholipase L1 biosynthesis ATPase subunit